MTDTNPTNMWLTSTGAFWRDPVTGQVFDLQPDEEYPALPADAVRLASETLSRALKEQNQRLGGINQELAAEVSGLRAERQALWELLKRSVRVTREVIRTPIPRWDEDALVISQGWLEGRCGKCGEEYPANLVQARRELEEAKRQAAVRCPVSGIADEHPIGSLPQDCAVCNVAEYVLSGTNTGSDAARWAPAVPAVDESGESRPAPTEPHPAREWGYRYVDTPLAYVPVGTEAQAHEKADADFSVEVIYRDPGEAEWTVVEDLPVPTEEPGETRDALFEYGRERWYESRRVHLEGILRDVDRGISMEALRESLLEAIASTPARPASPQENSEASDD